MEAYGAVMKEYVVVPDSLLKKTKELTPYIEKSFAYVKTLKKQNPVQKRKRSNCLGSEGGLKKGITITKAVGLYSRVNAEDGKRRKIYQHRHRHCTRLYCTGHA